MAVYDLSFYNVDADSIFSRNAGEFSTYTGPASAEGTATITDNGTGGDDLTLEDEKKGETATATTTLNGTTVSGTLVDAERSWTVRDTVTGETFQVIRFRIDSGANQGTYTVSEQPLVVGRSYEIIAYDKDPDAGAGDPVLTYSEFVPESDGIVEGTAGDDIIDGSYTGDPHNDVVDGNDAPGSTPPVASELNWSDYTAGSDLRGGVTQDTGEITVNVSYDDVQTNETFEARSAETIYVATGETFSNSSYAYILANGSADNTTVTFDFSADSPTTFENGVENARFRISDIDGLSNGGSNFQDIVTVRAYDENGNEIAVNITGGSNHTVTGNTITAGLSNGSAADASGSALIEIDGPVTQIVVTYDNGGTTQQAIYISDIEFDAVPLGSDDDVINAGDGNDTVFAGFGDDTVDGGTGNDTIYGGAGADTLNGGTGNDTLHVGSGDSANGEDGDDTFIIDPTALDGSAITLVGGEGAETTGDTLDFNGQLVLGSIVYTNTDDNAGGLSGTATLLDGSSVTFSEMETIICFTTGALIETPYGKRRVETLRAGDLVLTRDGQPQPIRWAGQRTVRGSSNMAPISFKAGSIGNDQEFFVSPQHRMLIDDYRAQLYFGEEEVLIAAKHLVDQDRIVRQEVDLVCYHHLLFDNHEIIKVNNVWSESYQPGAYNLSSLDEKGRDEMFTIFPELRLNPISYGKSARMSLNGRQAKVLAA